MRNILLSFSTLLVAISATAQDTYENARIATEDLNGTARYVGMGGAMDALGADISTIGTNPAGIGMFRHSTAKVSFGFVSLQDVNSFANVEKTNMSFDQAGFVYSQRTTGGHSFFNFAFNYHKSTNFNQILSAADRLSGASQNNLSYLKGANGMFGLNVNNGIITGNNNKFNTIDYLYYNALLSGYDNNNNLEYYCYDANGYSFNRANSGYIGEYDFNISGNYEDRIYLGLTFGIHDVHYNGFSEYTENLISSNGTPIGGVTIGDERRITGTGYNLKMGLIFRPIENSPFRVGLSVATPTWYDLTTNNYTTIKNNSSAGEYGTGAINEEYAFKLYTPWKFGLSLGTTVGNYLALGAGYEYADYGYTDSRINTGGGYDWYYDEYYTNSNSDIAMNSHTKRTLRGVSTVKVGLEFKPEADLAIRLGYNYVSPMYNKNGYKDFTIDSPGTYYSSATDYTNWKATNRITCGLGYNVEKFSFDVAYQYTVKNGDFSPFTNYAIAANDYQYDQTVNPVKISDKRHQVIFTMGYTF